MALLGSGFNTYYPTVNAAAAQYDIPAPFLASILQQESSFNPDVGYSSTGAYGIAQFMPATAAALGVNRSDPVSSIFGAAHLLRQNLDRSGGSLADAASMYYSGKKASVSSAGAGYAAQVLGRATKIADSAVGGVLSKATGALSGKVSSLLNSAVGAAAMSNPVTASIFEGANLLGINPFGGDECGWFCQFKAWVASWVGPFFTRLGLGFVALIFILMAFYLLGRSTPEFKAAARTFS